MVNLVARLGNFSIFNMTSSPCPLEAIEEARTNKNKLLVNAKGESQKVGQDVVPGDRNS